MIINAPKIVLTAENNIAGVEIQSFENPVRVTEESMRSTVTLVTNQAEPIVVIDEVYHIGDNEHTITIEVPEGTTVNVTVRTINKDKAFLAKRA